MKKFVIILAIFVYTATAFAQDSDAEEKGFKKEKLFAGGNFGLSFGRFTFINLSPQLGYRFNKFFAAGIGANVVYASNREDDLYGNDYRKVVQGITGLNVFARFYPTPKFLLQFQPEANYIFGKEIYYQPTKQQFKLNAQIVPSLLAGGGVVVPTERGAFLTTVFFDILQRPESPYGNRPIVNIGYNFNLR